jgi:hypothetical protein
MSLTSLLRAGDGPFWEWFEANLPETQNVCTRANRELRGGGAKEPCAVPPTPGTDHGLVGTAVGYLFSAHLRPTALDHTVATNAAALLDAPLRDADVPPSVIERLVVARIVGLEPSRQIGDAAQWTELCRLIAILARFEQYFRAGPAVLPYLAGPITEHGNNLAELALALINEPSMSDLETLGRATLEDLADIREAHDLHVGPNFVQSIPLGGADADLIYDGTLIDLKSTSQPRVVGREEIWQLLGYLFADTDDTYGISRVGFAALRRRRSLFWKPEGLIRKLTGGQAIPLQRLRDEFASVLSSLAPRIGTTRRDALQSLMHGE